MKIITINRPINTGNTLNDLLAVMPVKYNNGDLFKFDKTDLYCEYYKGKGKRLGVKIYSPIYFEGHLSCHNLIFIQPNGKTRETSEMFDLNLEHYDS